MDILVLSATNNDRTQLFWSECLHDIKVNANLTKYTIKSGVVR